MSFMGSLRRFYHIMRLLGPGFVAHRAVLALERSLGVTRRRFAPRRWESLSLTELCGSSSPTDPGAYSEWKTRNPPPFLFPLGAPPDPRAHGFSPTGARSPSLTERLDLLDQNRCVYFFRTPSPGPVDWHHNPFGDDRAPSDRVWCDIPDFARDTGDARTMWEPSRAAWALDLARTRAFDLQRNEERVCQRMLESWMRACPPFQGFQWKCGQEAAIRFIAASFASWCFASPGCADAERWLPFARLAWATGYRIAGHISYAISQGNNHALSEACGLLLVSHLFPEFREAKRWNALGRQVMATQLRRQFHPDGSYVQWSFNYQRVAMQVSTLALRIAELGGEPFDRDLYSILRDSALLLVQMMDSETGRMPNYGNNDGAWVLPLSECEFADFRPSIQAAYFLAERKRLFRAGPWNEDLLWLFGATALETATMDGNDRGVPTAAIATPQSGTFPVGGYHTIRRERSWALLRCHTYRTRPGQYDAMHLDLWWKGINVLQDTGTFQYYDPDREALTEYFRSSRAHNTLQLDRADPCDWVSRFLHVPWSRCIVRRFDVPRDGALCIEAERRDYDRGPWNVLHRRTIVSLPTDVWMVVDDLLGVGRHHAAVFWHMPDLPFEFDVRCRSVQLSTSAGAYSVHVTSSSGRLDRFEVVRGCNDAGHVQGFASPQYGIREPIPVVVGESEGLLPRRIVTVAGPGRSAKAECGHDDGFEEPWDVTLDSVRYRVRLSLPTRESEPTFLGMGV